VWNVVLSLLLSRTMPGKPWTTQDQANFLQSYVVQFQEAQANRDLSTFWPRIFREWFERFPEKEAIFPECEALTEAQEGQLKEAINQRYKVSAGV
jgi:hypothetical protein